MKIMKLNVTIKYFVRIWPAIINMCSTEADVAGTSNTFIATLAIRGHLKWFHFKKLMDPQIYLMI